MRSFFLGLQFGAGFAPDWKMRNTNTESTSAPPYFVATTELGRPNVNSWVKTKATTVAGAKRLAAKLPRRLTTTAKVAIQNPQGEFETIATLEDFSAITRSRPLWLAHRGKTGQASA